MKTCISCNTEKPLTDFRDNRRKCRKCENLKSSEWQKQNYERALEANRASYTKRYNDPEKRLARQRQNQTWKQNNPERVKELSKRYAERRKTWKTPKFGDEAVTNEYWLEKLVYYQYRCAYCFRTADTLEQEHIIPLSRGGTHTLNNLVPSCKTCNLSKGSKTAEEWVMRGA